MTIGKIGPLDDRTNNTRCPGAVLVIIEVSVLTPAVLNEILARAGQYIILRHFARS
jgi:hypothetical protein